MDLQERESDLTVRGGALHGLASAGLMFCFLGAFSVASGGWSALPAGLGLSLVGHAAFALARRRPRLCTLTRTSEGLARDGAMLGVPEQLSLRWSGPHTAELELSLRASGGSSVLLRHPDVSGVLAAAHELSGALRVPCELDVRARLELGAARTSPREAPSEAAAPSTPARRAARALVSVGVLIALYVAFVLYQALVAPSSGGQPTSLHPSSLVFAALAPLVPFGIAAVSLRSFIAQRAVTERLLGAPASQRGVNERREALADGRSSGSAFATLAHPTLGLAYLWLVGNASPVLVSSDATRVRGLTELLRAQGLPELFGSDR